ncbi:CRP/FNR family transcriptional regulator [Cytobacillus firmus]|uniref:CRP/FNR family transcriptional regulator n=2 Tax=Cytobacillus TaxID=2675230 RepID=A0A366JD61_CYTFI|nr:MULTISPECIES: Crp/Fnr family transcriptional regulator [Cytobacillus]RBP84913.1 CRP/FNR family transcriptional regulator [Cytobacillus firmus]TDX36351.1 CRP/FNR family transcriptional regulator [Cytobacillus oceanisediminis]
MDKLMLLSQINIFDELPKEELKKLDQVTLTAPIKKGTIILSPTQQLRSLFFLKKGQVRLYKVSSTGKEFTVDLLSEGNVFGETSSFSLTESEIYAETMVDSFVCTLTKDQFEDFIRQNPAIAINLITILTSKLKEMYQITESIAYKDVKYRIVLLLMQLSNRFGVRSGEWQTVEVKITQHDIASMIGSSRETVSLFLGELEKEEVIMKKPLKINTALAKELYEVDEG